MLPAPLQLPEIPVAVVAVEPGLYPRRMNPVPRDVLARLVRDTAAEHDRWDRPHQFQTLHWDGATVTAGHVASITLDVDPDDIPRLIMAVAAEQFAAQPGQPPCAYLLEWEGHGVPGPGPGASAAERAQFGRDARDRALHRRPDALEVVTVICADIHGRVWKASKMRDTGEVAEVFCRPGSPVPGRLNRAVLQIAETTGLRLRLAT